MDKRFVLIRMTDLGLKQNEMARRLNLDKAAMSNLLNGKRLLKANEVVPLANLLQVSPLEVLNNLNKG